MSNQNRIQDIYSADGLKSTADYREAAERCEDVETFCNDLQPLYKSYGEEWSKYITNLVNNSGYTKEEYANMCGVSRVTLNKWCKGVFPDNREKFKKIGIAAGLNIEKIDGMLKRFGGYTGIYAKNREDCVCSFVLKNYSSEKGYTNKDRSDKYNEIVKAIDDNVLCKENNAGVSMTTERVNETISYIDDDKELIQFINDNSNIYASAYNRFRARVLDMLDDENLGMCSLDGDDKTEKSQYKDIADSQNWSRNLRQVYNEIKDNVWRPTRKMVISLGIHMNLNCDGIDNLLDLAGMERLCGKNMYEGAVIFAVSAAEMELDMDDNGNASMSDVDVMYDRVCEILTELADRCTEYGIEGLSEFIKEIKGIKENEQLDIDVR